MRRGGTDSAAAWRTSDAHRQRNNPPPMRSNPLPMSGVGTEERRQPVPGIPSGIQHYNYTGL